MREAHGTVNQVVLKINSDTDILMARQAVREAAQQVGFGLIDETRLVTAVSELARNALNYGGGGQVTVRALREPLRAGIEIICEDQGPGIEEPEKALAGGWSTGGGLGRGLSGTRSLMDEFELLTAPGAGTSVVVRKWKRR